MSETTTGIDRTVTPYQASEGKGALDGRRYLESLRDGREVWYRGQRIEDVTTHPVFRRWRKTLPGFTTCSTLPKPQK